MAFLIVGLLEEPTAEIPSRIWQKLMWHPLLSVPESSIRTHATGWPTCCQKLKQHYFRSLLCRPWAVLYLVFLAFAVIGGIWTAQHRNRDFFDIAKAGYLDDSRHCPKPAAGLGAALQEQQHSATLDIGNFTKHAGKWLIASAAGSLLV